MSSNKSFTNQDIAQQLQTIYSSFSGNQLSLKSLFEQDDKRAERFSIDDLCFLDYSKNWVTTESLDLLCKLADYANLDDKINSLFSGQNINVTEDRAVLHTALRDLNNNIKINNANINELIASAQNKIKDFCYKLHNNQLLGFSGKPINTIVNIGIGGSDLGPKMVYHALKPYWNKNINCYFISNIDPSEVSSLINHIDPEQTIFIVSSKSFKTSETLTNATTARNWMLKYCSFTDLKSHFIGITSNIPQAIDFGIDINNILPLWDWVGGRYSLWSAIGLSIAMGTSYEVFQELLAGANALDQHFKAKPWQENLPVILALLSTGYINFANCQTHALLPYCQSLEYFTDYIQQLDMESNGKSVNTHDQEISYKTGPIIWGAPGTNGQHAFHQLLHQGTHIVPCDFIVPVKSNYAPDKQQQMLVANAFAQSKTLLDGFISDKYNYKTLTGNKPSSTILLPELTPYYLGVLIAMYEHKVFTQGAIWNINSFDQWGVERGKIIADAIIPYLSYNKTASIDVNNLDFDVSTSKLITKYKEFTNNVP